MTFVNVNGQVMPSGPGGWVANPANVITVNGVPSSAATEVATGTLAVDPTNLEAYINVKNSGINGTVSWLRIGGSPSIAAAGTTAAMTAGTITVNTTAVTANSIIMLTENTSGGTVGTLKAPTGSITPGVSFVITSSSNLDTSTVNWAIIN